MRMRQGANESAKEQVTVRAREWTVIRGGLEGIGEADGKDGEDRGVAEVVVVAVDEGLQVFLESGVAVDRFAADRGRLGGVTCAAGEGDLEPGLADVVEAHLEGNADVAPCARDDVSEAEGEAGGELAEVNASVSVKRVGVAADVVLSVECDGAAGGDQ